MWNKKIYSIDKQSLIGIVGHTFFICLGVLSVIFYKERMLYYDPAYFSFWMINDVNFSIALGRWGAILSQLLPLWAIGNKFSIESILQLYSLSFILVYYFIFLIIYHGFKDVVASVVLILSLCLTFRITFYYPTAELYHGIAISVLFWVVLKNIATWSGFKSYMGILLCIAIAVCLSYFHQLTLLLVLFFLVLEWFSGSGYRDRKLIIIGILSLIWFVIRIKFLTVSEYEKEKLLGVSDFLTQLTHLNANPTLSKYFSFLYTQAIIPVAAFIISTILLLKNKPRVALFCLVSFIGFSVLVIVTLYRGESIIMTENYFTVLGVFMAVPIVLAMIDYRSIFLISILTILCADSLVRIQKASTPLTNRIGVLENMVHYGRQFPNKKYIIQENNHKDDYFWSSWSMPFETLLLSSLKNNDEAVTFFIKKESLILNEKDLNQENIFLGPEWSPFWLKTNSFNKYYYNLPGGPYLFLSSNQDSFQFNQGDFSNQNFKIEPMRKQYLGSDEVTIRLSNLSNQVLPSVPGKKLQIHIGYHLMDENNKLIQWDNPRTMIDFDVHPNKSLQQHLIVTPPSKPGKYILQLDLVTEGIRWWNINSQAEIIFKK